jgi:hypothetical protein
MDAHHFHTNSLLSTPSSSQHSPESLKQHTRYTHNHDSLTYTPQKCDNTYTRTCTRTRTHTHNAHTYTQGMLQRWPRGGGLSLTTSVCPHGTPQTLRLSALGAALKMLSGPTAPTCCSTTVRCVTIDLCRSFSAPSTQSSKHPSPKSPRTLHPNFHTPFTQISTHPSPKFPHTLHPNLHTPFTQISTHPSPKSP